MPTEDLKVRVGANTTGLNQALSRATKTVGEFSTSVTKYAKRAAFAFTGIITAAGILGAKFDKEMRFVGAITNATADEFVRLTAIAEEMGRTTEFTASQAAQGLRYLGMAGLTAEEAIKALPGALDLATAGELDLGRAADIATNILSQFSLEVDELTRVNDVLAKVQTTANTNIDQAAEAFIYGGTMAKQFGMNIEQLSAFVGLLANRGIKASLAGTTLRQAMIKLLNPSSEATEIMKRYGITVTDSEGNLRNFTDVILDMVDAQISTKDSAILLGARASQLASIFNMTTDEIVDYIHEMENAEGTAKTLADSIRESFWGKWKEMISKVESALIVFFRTFESTGKAAFATVGMIMDKLRDHMTKNSESIANGFTTAFESIIRGAGATYNAIVKISSAISKFINFGRKALNRAEEQLYLREERESSKYIATKGKQGWIGDIRGLSDEEAMKQARKINSEAKEKLALLRSEFEVLDAKDFNVDDQVNKMTDIVDGVIGSFKKFRTSFAEELAKVENQKKTDEFMKTILGGAVQDQATGIWFPGSGGFERKSETENFTSLAQQVESTGQILNDVVIKSIADLEDKVKEKMTEVEFDVIVEKVNNMKEEIEKKLEELDVTGAEKGIKKLKDYIEKTVNKVDISEAKNKMREFQQDVEELAYGIAVPIGDSFLDIIKGTKSVGDAFKSMADQIISEILRIAIRQAIIQPIAKGIGGLFGLKFHEGGIVGMGGSPVFASANLWKDAPRLHMGTNEYPAILERGEQVIPKKDVGKSGNTYVTVKLENPVFQDLEAQRQSMAIIAETITRKIAPDAIHQDYMNDGISRDLIRSRA